MAQATQIRLTQVTASYGTATGLINDQGGFVATGSANNADLVGVLSNMASAIKRIHGFDSFTEAGPGKFNLSVSSSVGLESGGSLTVAGASTFNGSVNLPSSNLTVGGNLTVNGTTFTVNSTNVAIKDPIIIIGSSSDAGVAGDGDRGIIFASGSTGTGGGNINPVFFYNRNQDRFQIAYTGDEGSATAAITTTAMAPVEAGSIQLGAMSINTNANTVSAGINDLFLAAGAGKSVVATGDLATSGTLKVKNIGTSNEVFSVANDGKIVAYDNVNFTAAAATVELQVKDNTAVPLKFRAGTTGNDLLILQTTTGQQFVNAVQVLSASAGIKTNGSIVRPVGGLVVQAEAGGLSLLGNGNVSVSSTSGVVVLSGSGHEFKDPGGNVRVKFLVNENQFAQKITAAPGTLLTISGAAGQDTRLQSGRDLFFDDVYRPSSTFSTSLKLAAASSEWDTFESNYGEVSILNALNQAKASATSLADKSYYKRTGGTLNAGVALGGASFTPNFGTVFDGVPSADRNKRVDLFVNGQLLLSKSFDGVVFDYDIEPGTGNITFEFPLENDDVVLATVR